MEPQYSFDLYTSAGYNSFFLFGELSVEWICLVTDASVAPTRAALWERKHAHEVLPRLERNDSPSYSWPPLSHLILVIGCLHHSILPPRQPTPLSSCVMYSEGGLCSPEDQGWRSGGGKEQRMNSLLPLLASCDIIHQALGWDSVSFTLEKARMYLLGSWLTFYSWAPTLLKGTMADLHTWGLLWRLCRNKAALFCDEQRPPVRCQRETEEPDRDVSTLERCPPIQSTNAEGHTLSLGSFNPIPSVMHLSS